MAHFAQLDENNIVLRVDAVNNVDTSDQNGFESEYIGIGYLHAHHGADKIWKQTSYNATDGKGFRGNYAGIGYTYMTGVQTLGVASTDIFIRQQPFPSWTISTAKAEWIPPNPPGEHPKVGVTSIGDYVWNESNYQSNPATAWVFEAQS